MQMLLLLAMVKVGEVLMEDAKLTGQSPSQLTFSFQPLSLHIMEVFNYFLGIIIRIFLVNIRKFLQFFIQSLDLGYNLSVLHVEDRHVLNDPGELSPLILENFCYI